jgi:ethanolamine utilization microcompartment shell protein EutL
MEVFPAAYAGLAMNEAEKTADVDVVYISNSGRYGRLFFSGSESNVLTAKDAAGAALSVVEGRSP